MTTSKCAVSLLGRVERCHEDSDGKEWLINSPDPSQIRGYSFGGACQEGQVQDDQARRHCENGLVRRKGNGYELLSTIPKLTRVSRSSREADVRPRLSFARNRPPNL